MRKWMMVFLVVVSVFSFGIAAAQDDDNVLVMARAADTTGLIHIRRRRSRRSACWN